MLRQYSREITESMTTAHVQSDSPRFDVLTLTAFLSLEESPVYLLAYNVRTSACVISHAKAETDVTSLTIKC